MKEDRAITILGVLGIFYGIMALTTGHPVMGGIAILLAASLFMNRGRGKFNDRSIYENIVKTDLQTDDLFDKLSGISTPLGKAWKARSEGNDGDVIVFGPDTFRDCVVIGRRKGVLSVRHTTRTDTVIRDSADEYRFRDFVNAGDVEVTPKRYSIFVSFKLASVMMVRHLAGIIENLDKDPSAAVPESIDIFRFYYHNSADGSFRDEEDREVMKVECSTDPFTARLTGDEGEELASVRPRAFSSKGAVIDSEGFDLYANGEHFGEITRSSEGGDTFRAVTDAGDFTVRVFPACRRANVACNYVIEQEGEIRAVIGGSPNILFDSHGRCQNDVILSYDDDYLVFYAVMEIFIMTLNRKFLK